MENLALMLQETQQFYNSGSTRQNDWRISGLKALRQQIIQRETAILDAIKSDFGKGAFDSYSTEVLMVLEELDEAIAQLARWSKPRKASTGLPNFPSRGYVLPQPLGTVLIISPWNYPFLLALAPLVGAIAAGNCVFLKPTSKTPATSAIIAELLTASFPPQAVRVIAGEHEISDALLELPFDFIFFTGSPNIGKKVMAKAAVHLTPVVLELGGKSPCLVEADAALPQAAQRIVWGKFINGGQTCVAPDYLLVQQSIAAEFTEMLIETTKSFYYNDEKLTADFPQIITAAHYERLLALANGNGKIVWGGRGDAAIKTLEPTILTDIQAADAIMQQEIFGPILPILTYEKLDDALAFIQARPKPLALYVFTQDKRQARHILAQTASGGACINDTVMHVACKNLPFGGVGNSGMGKYHGKYSFDTFSNLRGVLDKSATHEVKLKYPPHASNKIAVLKKLLRQK